MNEGANSGSRRAAVAAWIGLTAPGALITCAILAVALMVTPWLTPLVAVPMQVRVAAAALLIAHALVALLLRLRVGSLAAWLFMGALAADALLCGVLMRGDRGAAPLLAVAVLAMSLEVGGWVVALISVAAWAVGIAAAGWAGLDTVVFRPMAPVFPTTLAVETFFAGTAVITSPPTSFATTLSVETAAAGSAMTFPTVLSVETSLSGVPALATADELFIPTLTLVLIALSLGLATSLWRVRRARTAVAASIVAAARVTP